MTRGNFRWSARWYPSLCRFKVFCFANQLACVSRFLPQKVFSLLWLLCWSNKCFPLVGVLTGIRPARARSQVCLSHLGVSGTWHCGPVLCGLDTGLLVALACASMLRCLSASLVEPSPLRVRRVRLKNSEYVSIERPNMLSPGSW